MPTDLISSLRSRYRQISEALDAATGGAEREAVKRDIIAFFKEVDGLVTDLSTIREEVRALAERYKQLAAGARAETAPQPQFVGERPVLHADHLGASTFIEKGWSLIALGDYPGAAEALGRALSLAPGDAQAESLLGWAQMLMQDYDSALASFGKVLEQDPTNTVARINLGFVCFKRGSFPEAIEHLSKAIRLANDKKATLYAHFYLGLVYRERAMHEEAESFFKKTLELGPNLIEAYYELGRTQWDAGRRAEAQATWEAGFSANKFSPWGKRCREMLELVAKGGGPPRGPSA